MRAQRARRAGGRGARMAVGAAVALTTASMLALCLPVDAQEASDVGALSDTLKRGAKVRARSERSGHAENPLLGRADEVIE